jgi:hypothetical protein
MASLASVRGYIKTHWQAGDVIYHTGDSSMINFMPYMGAYPHYQMPECDKDNVTFGPSLGSLSIKTRDALGINMRPLADISYRRAWVVAARSPLISPCAEHMIDLIAPIGKQVILIDDGLYFNSGVWLVER